MIPPPSLLAHRFKNHFYSSLRIPSLCPSPESDPSMRSPFFPSLPPTWRLFHALPTALHLQLGVATPPQITKATSRLFPGVIAHLSPSPPFPPSISSLRRRRSSVTPCRWRLDYSATGSERPGVSLRPRPPFRSPISRLVKKRRFFCNKASPVTFSGPPFHVLFFFESSPPMFPSLGSSCPHSVRLKAAAELGKDPLSFPALSIAPFFSVPTSRQDRVDTETASFKNKNHAASLSFTTLSPVSSFGPFSPV